MDTYGCSFELIARAELF